MNSKKIRIVKFFTVDLSFFVRYRSRERYRYRYRERYRYRDRDRDRYRYRYRDRYFDCYFEFIIFNYFFKPNINCEDF